MNMSQLIQPVPSYLIFKYICFHWALRWLALYLIFVSFFCFFFFLAVLSLHCGTQAFSSCGVGLACCSACALEHSGSLIVCGLRGSAACGFLVPQPGIEALSRWLEGGFLTSGPPGKSLYSFFRINCRVGLVRPNNLHTANACGTHYSISLPKNGAHLQSCLWCLKRPVS